MKISKRTLQVLALASLVYVLSSGGVSLEPATAPATVALGIQTRGEPRTPSIEQHADPTLIREAHSDGGYWYYR